MFLTYRYRIKDSTSKRKLKKLASSVNFVWNYVNELAIKSVKQRGHWMSKYDITPYLNEAGAKLDLAQQSLREIARTYVKCRKTHKKLKLKWRSSKRSLGWIPFVGHDVKVNDDSFTYKKQAYRFYRSRSLPEGSRVRSGSVTQDARDRWYVSFIVDVPEASVHAHKGSEVGIDLGVKNQVTLSTGEVFARSNLTRGYELKLAFFQRAGKKKQVRNLQAKVKNKRLDWAHKLTTDIARSYEKIIVGDLKANEVIAKNKKISKGIYDAAPSSIVFQLEYKAKRLGGETTKVSECWTTVTCSSCLQKTGPIGSNGLSVREWKCRNCDAIHDRDVNAAKNILRLNTQTPLREPF